ncbi:MAG: stage II sporulation protein D [Thermoanaerobacteraceae bacterium]|nr:stage II sporulation protein D [Thermoanaerobacteraceae bacterium]
MKKTLFWLFAGVLILLVLLPSVVLKLQGPHVEVKNAGTGIRVKMHDTGKVMVMPLEEYLVGVVAGEMPAHFHMEALKAQAIAARTYTLNKLKRTTKDTHYPEADVCTDPAHCQAWISRADMKRKWGIINYWKYYSKVVRAVKETEGLVITYHGRLIEPVYHSTSGGRTEAAAEVWQYDFPYLQSVKSEWDKQSPYYRNTQTFTLQEVDRKLGTNLNALPAATLGKNSLLKVLERTVSGRVKTIQVGRKKFTGSELRRRLGLSSTYIDWQVTGDKIIFFTRGYGHGVGLSQYGANGMAKAGKNFKDILTYYYRGVSIKKIDN